MAGEDRGRGAAPDAALDREQGPALRASGVMPRGGCPPASAGDHAFFPPDIVESFERLRRLADFIQQGVAHEQDAVIRRVAARAQRLGQLAGEALQRGAMGFVLDSVRHRYAQFAEQIAHQIDVDIRHIRFGKRLRDTAAHIVERNERVAHNTPSRPALWISLRTRKVACRCGATSSFVKRRRFA